MINNVKKADGSVAPFDPDKLNTWGEWADKVGLNWSNIVLQAVKKCYDGCSTRELQQAMIDACRDKKDEAHLLMGGRLLMGNIYKEAFGGHDKIPSLYDFYTRMVNLGFWEQMDYTKEEIDSFDDLLDHTRDLTLSYTELNQLRSKYLVMDRVANICYEVPQFMYIGMAMKNMESEPKGRRSKDVAGLFKYLSEKKINAPTPFMVNLRTPKRGYASCCVSTTLDSAASLNAADTINYLMTCASAGIGAHHRTRSAGDAVRQGQIKHMGKLPYYRMVVAAVNANVQSSRGGAATTYFNMLDPEIENLLMLKSPTTVVQRQIRGMDYSFGTNKFFAKRAAKKGNNWMLISIAEAPDLYDAMYKDDEVEFSKLYAKYDQDFTVKKTYVDAQELLLLALTQRVETGRIYEHFTDRMNGQTPFKDTIWSSNLCVAPETKILTDKGYEIICEKEGHEINVWNGNEFSKVTVLKTGEDRPLIKVITDSGYELECTPYHRFYVQRGYYKGVGDDKLEIKEVRAKDLNPGDKLIKFELPTIEGAEDFNLPYENGFYSGDGCSVGPKEQRVYLYGKKKLLLESFEGDFKVYDQPKQDRVILTYPGTLSDKFTVPSPTHKVEDRLEWLAGFADSDGTVLRNGSNTSVSLCNTNKEFLKEIQLLLQATGVESKVRYAREEGFSKMPKNDGTGEKADYLCKAAYRLTINSIGLEKLIALGIKFRRLNVESANNPNRSASHLVKIRSVEDLGRKSDTYCFSEPLRHMGMFNGILTGQCQEIALPTKGYPSVTDLYSPEGEGEIGLCSLSAIVAGRVSEEEYPEVAYYTLKMVDNVIELMDYPFPQLERTAKARRSIGIGITNLAYAMAKNKYSYSSLEGKNYIHRLAELHSYSLHKASLQLAKEKGLCEWIDKTKYPDGWFPHDDAAPAVDIAHTQPLLQDWESLRKEIVDFGGIRHSVLEAHMPCESSSVASATLNGLYPVRGLKVTKGSGKEQNNVVIVPEYETLKDWYEIAFDVPTKDLIEDYAIVQKFTGQGISADYFYVFKEGEERKVSAKQLLSDYLYAIKMGMKGAYYFNSRTTVTGTNTGLREEVAEVVEDEADCAACKL